MSFLQTKYEVTPRTILFASLLVVGAWLLYEIRDILQLLFIAFIFMTALRPVVDGMQRKGIPRLLAIFTTYLVVIGAIIFCGTMIVPAFVVESVKLFNNLPQYLAQAIPVFNFNANTFLGQLTPIGQNVARLTLGLFSNIITSLTVAVLTFYFLLERNNLEQLLGNFLGDEAGGHWVEVVRHIETRLGAWVRGQLLLGTIIGMATFIALTLLSIPFALPLAIIAGVLEMVPIIGPLISAVPSILIALSVSPQLALLTAGSYFIIQQLENNIVVPLVMHRAVGIPPLASLIALLVGGKLGGFMGVLLAIPILLVLQTVLNKFLLKSSKRV